MLKPKQMQLIPLIVELGSIEAACRAAKISRSTYYEWLKNKEFAKELEKRQDYLYQNAMVKLKSLHDDAVKAYQELVNSNNESIKLRAAKIILDDLAKYKEINDFDVRIEALEKDSGIQKGRKAI